MIDQLRDEIPVARLSRVLPVSRSGYCGWRKRRNQPLCRRKQEDARLLPLIREAHKAAHGVYGYPRVCLALRDAGEL